MHSFAHQSQSSQQRATARAASTCADSSPLALGQRSGTTAPQPLHALNRSRAVRSQVHLSQLLNQRPQVVAQAKLSAHLQAKSDHTSRDRRAGGGHPPGRATSASEESRSARQPLQRLLDADAFEQKFSQQHSWFGWRSPYTDPSFARIHQAVSQYHRVPKLVEEEGPEAVNHWRLSQLDAAEHEIYAWHDANRGQPNHPKMAAIKELLVDLQKTHQDEIENAVAGGFKLWVPQRDQMTTGEQERLDDLWSALSTGRHLDGARSKLQVYSRSRKGLHGEAEETSPDFKKQINAMHARLLTGRHGRHLLEQLVYQGTAGVDDGRSIRVRPSHSTDRSDQASASPGDKDLDRKHLEKLRGKAARPKYSTRLQQWVPGKGTGSRVTVNPGFSDVKVTHADESAHDLLSEHDTKILSPAFIVYGHELGHALNNLLGMRKDKIDTHLYDANEVSESRVKRRRGLGIANYVSKDQQSLVRWENKEEHDVISNIENALRDEHGITRRKYHH